ncbi:MAG TPA: hypothetical protein VIE67_04565 [Rudaea sp.]|jgi:hypothetical protein|uniref:hypothetical protein n=1 Tax=Rudaea sp. TaxID=2136325 RepID=UPI002F930159
MVDAERLRMLMAMGVDVYALRSRTATNAAAMQSVSASANAPAEVATPPRVVVVCAQGVRRDARLARLLAQLPQAIGVDAVDWLDADAHGTLAMPPSAPAYLVLGAAMARALGVQLSTMQQNSSTIAVTADPAQLPGSAADKRALWQALKPLAKRLRGLAG